MVLFSRQKLVFSSSLVLRLNIIAMEKLVYLFQNLVMKPEDLVLVQIAQQCERYEDITKIFKQMVFDKPLSQQEIALLSSAYKNILSERRTAWRAVSTYEDKMIQNKAEQEVTSTIAWYKKKIQKQIRGNCLQALQITDKLLSISPPESQIFYQRMKGDYYRYLSQISKELELKQNQQNAVKSYEQAIRLLGSASVGKTNPLKLGVSLNLSVFYYEILGNTNKAIQICQKAFNQASDKLNDISDDQFKDTTTIMQLMYDNLTQWKLQSKS